MERGLRVVTWCMVVYIAIYCDFTSAATKKFKLTSSFEINMKAGHDFVSAVLSVAERSIMLRVIT